MQLSLRLLVLMIPQPLLLLPPLPSPVSDSSAFSLDASPCMSAVVLSTTMLFKALYKVKNVLFLCLLFFPQFYVFILLYNIALVLPYINMNPPRVYMCSPS